MIAIGFLFIHDMNGPIWGQAFFDARAFTHTIELIRDGHSPYALPYGRDPALTHPTMVQPPHLAILLQAIAATAVPVVVIDALIFVWIASGIAAGIWVGVRLFFDFTSSTLALCAGIFASFIAGAGMVSILTGNVAGALWGPALFAAYAGFKTKNWRWFHAAVCFAVLFKPFYVALWIIPVLAHGWSWRQVWLGAAGTLFCAAIYLAGVKTAPDFLVGWLDNLNARHDVGDVGWGFYALLRETPLGSVGALGLHAIYAAGLVATCVFAPMSPPMRYAALIITAIIVNPRMNAYDFAYAALPAAYVYVTRLRQVLPWAWVSPAACLAVAAASCFVFRWNYHAANLAIMAITGVAVALAAYGDIVTRAFGPLIERWLSRSSTAAA